MLRRGAGSPKTGGRHPDQLKLPPPLPATAAAVFGDFLIHASSFNNAEATGTPLFQFKQSDPFSGVDAVFTPLSLFILMNHGRGVAARVEAGGGLTRMANLLYDREVAVAEASTSRAASRWPRPKLRLEKEAARSR